MIKKVIILIFTNNYFSNEDTTVPKVDGINKNPNENLIPETKEIIKKGEVNYYIIGSLTILVLLIGGFFFIKNKNLLFFKLSQEESIQKGHRDFWNFIKDIMEEDSYIKLKNNINANNFKFKQTIMTANLNDIFHLKKENNKFFFKCRSYFNSSNNYKDINISLHDVDEFLSNNKIENMKKK